MKSHYVWALIVAEKAAKTEPEFCVEIFGIFSSFNCSKMKRE